MISSINEIIIICDSVKKFKINIKLGFLTNVFYLFPVQND